LDAIISGQINACHQNAQSQFETCSQTILCSQRFLLEVAEKKLKRKKNPKKTP
jgi:hypothetical protein